MYHSLRNLVVGLCVAIFGSAYPFATAQEINLINGDFELYDPEFDEGLAPFGWVDFTGPPTVGNAQMSFTTETGGAPQGDYYGRIENLYQNGGAAVIKQANTGVGVVQPLQPVRVSFYARGEFGVGGVQFAELFSEQDGGGTSKAEILGGGPLFDPGQVPPTEFTFFEFFSTLGSDVVGGVTVQFAAATGAVPGGFSILEIDDLVIEVFDPLAGDFNLDNVVDAADYTVWRDNLGLSDAALNGNGTGHPSGNVVAADYALWRSSFGNTLSGSIVLAGPSGTSVPEPTSLGILASVACWAAFWQRRTVRRRAG